MVKVRGTIWRNQSINSKSYPGGMDDFQSNFENETYIEIGKHIGCWLHILNNIFTLKCFLKVYFLKDRCKDQTLVNDCKDEW